MNCCKQVEVRFWLREKLLTDLLKCRIRKEQSVFYFFSLSIFQLFFLFLLHIDVIDTTVFSLGRSVNPLDDMMYRQQIELSLCTEGAHTF